MENIEQAESLEDLTQQLLINQLRYSKQLSQLTEFLNASGEYSILYLMYHEPDPHSAGEFAERLDLSPGRVANVLKALEKKDLIERKKDPSDGRRTMVTLTQKGREYICQTYTQAIDVYHNLIEEIGEHDTREFLRITKKLLEASRVLK
ncbi:MAG: MarR family transcriptional regulator [Blautia sp.]|nr:MarR family transcriptional regulator [Blautia sp.]